MTTNEQLKALAEAAKNWHVNHAMPENDDGIVEVGHMLDGEFYPIVIVDCVQYDQSSQPLAAYIAAANPERILALIAENERIRKANDSLKTEVSDVYASNTGYRLELERVRGLIRQHLIHHEHGCVYLDEALGETK